MVRQSQYLSQDLYCDVEVKSCSSGKYIAAPCILVYTTAVVECNLWLPLFCILLVLLVSQWHCATVTNGSVYIHAEFCGHGKSIVAIKCESIVSYFLLSIRLRYC